MSDLTLEQKLTAAQERLAAARALADNLTDKTPVDPGTFSGIRRKANAKADVARHARYDREAAAYAAIPPLEQRVKIIEAEIKERNRKRFTREEVLGAIFVLTEFGWKKVRRINTVSVSVESGYSWADKVPFDKIRAVRK